MAQIKRYERTQSIPQVGPIPRQTFTYDDLGKMYQVRATGMAQLGQQLGDMAQQLHEQRSAAEMVSARAAADAMLNDFMMELQKNPQDFQNYEALFLDKQKEVLDTVSASFTSKDAYRRFTQEFWPLYVENQRAKVQQLSLQKEADYTAGKMVENIELAVRSGDLGQLDMALKLAEQSGLISQNTLAKLRISGEDEIKTNIALRSIQDQIAAGKVEKPEDWVPPDEIKSLLTEKDMYTMRDIVKSELAERKRAEAEQKALLQEEADKKLFDMWLRPGVYPDKNYIKQLVNAGVYTLPEGHARVEMFEAKRNSEIKAYTEGLSSYDKQMLALKIPADQNSQLYNDFLRRIGTATNDREFFEIAQDLNNADARDWITPFQRKSLVDLLEYQSKAKDKASLNTYNSMRDSLQYALTLKVDEFIIEKPAMYTQLARFDDVARLSSYNPKVMASEARKILLSMPDWKLAGWEKIIGAKGEKQKIIDKYNEVIKYLEAIEIGGEIPEGYALPLFPDYQALPQEVRDAIYEKQKEVEPNTKGLWR